MEFSDIQPVSLRKQFQPTSVKTASDLKSFFNSQANAGDQIEMFFSIAESQPERAITLFSTVIRNEITVPIKALAIQGFGKISQRYKQALALCTTQESQELLKLLCNEIRNRNSDLTAWAALEALREIEFSQHYIQNYNHGNLSEPPRRIQNEILDQKIQEINRIQRLNSRGQFTAEYERFLEFWVYGPTTSFFGENIESQRYIEIANDILDIAQVRGIYLGLKSSNKKVQKLSLDKINSIFNQYEKSSQSEFKGFLSNSLKRFLKESKSSEPNLQILVKAFIYEEPKYNLENLRLSKLSSLQINQEIDQLKSLYSEISSNFSSAISISDDRIINEFISARKNECLNLISSWLKRLEQQIRIISNLSASQKSNADLILDIHNSIKNYDAALYLQISNDVHSRIKRLNSSSANTQEEQNSINNQLDEIKKLVNSSLSNKLNILKKEISELQDLSSANESMMNNMLKYGLILLPIGIFAEVMAIIITIIIFIIVFLIGSAMASGRG
jgi:hypothetical protein